MREKGNHIDEEINELQKKVTDLKLELVKDVGEIACLRRSEQRKLCESQKKGNGDGVE